MMKNLTIALSLFILMSANKCKNDTDGGTKSMDAMSSIADTKWVLQSLGGNALDLPEGNRATMVETGRREPKDSVAVIA
ncbi:MAG: hypothetical protein IPI91_04040 [Flavobacteriales bacterium]|nr:hypothetical protein [Flavobacteriales bacterium]